VNDDRTRWYTVTLRLHWWPAAEPDELAGRLLLHRKIVHDDRPGSPVSQFWVSAELDQLDLLSYGRPDLAGVWRRLAYGWAAGAVERPVRLTRADRRVLEELMRRLSEHPGAACPIRPVFQLRMRIGASGEHRRMASAALVREASDVVSQAFAPTLRRTLRTVRMAAADPPQSREPRPDERREPATADLPQSREPRPDERREPALTRIEFEDVRGALVGDHIVQVNTFVARPDQRELDFADVLRRSDVVRAIQRLQEAPDDPGRRDSLVDALSSDGRWSFWYRPVSLEVTEPQRNGFWELLRSLLVFDVRGLATGDHARQTNHFVYAVPALPTGADLLREDKGLAVALADYLCPRANAIADEAHLQDRLSATLAALPIAWRDGRIRDLLVYPPGECDAVRISHADGVAIGRNVRQESTELADVTGVALSRRLRRAAAVEHRRAADRHIDLPTRVPAEMSASERREVETARTRAEQARAEVDQAESAERKARVAWAEAEDDAERARFDAERSSVRALVAGDRANQHGGERFKAAARQAMEVARQDRKRAQTTKVAADHAREVLRRSEAAAQRVRRDADRLAAATRDRVHEVEQRLAAERARIDAQRVTAQRVHLSR
jgi:hypothetical protein